ncbi:hypothetical protein ACLB2K_049993 [Fragaria x ananassa]
MATYPEIPDVLLSSIHNLVNLRLESTNYFLWSHVMTTMFNAYDLTGYIDGSITSPAEDSPDFQRWRCYTSRVMCLLNATLTDAALSHVLHTDTARDMWEALKDRFTCMNNFNIIKYRSDLQTITKGDDSVGVYVKKIEKIVSKLCGFQLRLEDAEIIQHALRGLPVEYEAFRNSITAREDPLLTNHFYVLLLAEEASILAGNHH